MFKRLISFILLSVMSLFLLAGCSSNDSDKPEEFDAEHFVEDCKILMPAAKYEDADPKDFMINFTTTVFIRFGKSDYYKNMTEEERIEALNELGKVLETFSYGVAEDGFVTHFRVNKLKHAAVWNVKGYSDADLMWYMPGY